MKKGRFCEKVLGFAKNRAVGLQPRALFFATSQEACADKSNSALGPML